MGVFYVFFLDDIDDFTKNYEDGSSKSELFNILSVKKKAHTSQENWWVQTDVSFARNIQIEGLNKLQPGDFWGQLLTPCETGCETCFYRY